MNQAIRLIQNRYSGPTMSTGEKFFQLADYLTDRLNPILVKETRQALKSRQFIITFMLLLTVAWLISVFGIMVYGPAIEYGSAGRVFFGWYACVIGFATLFVVPFGSFRSMLSERDQDTYELLSISTLTPRQIVMGKLLSSVVQVFIYYSAIAPFIAFTSLLQGFDFPMVLLVLFIGLVWSVSTSMIAIMLSTLSENRQWQAMNTIGMIGLLLGQFIVGLPASGFALSGVIPFDSSDFWWALSCWLISTFSYFLLAQQIAVSRLTFESGNRSSGIRIIVTMQFWLLWMGLFVYGWWNGMTTIDNDSVFALAIMSCIHWMIAGLIFSTEHEDISRRVRRWVPRSTIARLMIAPWMPGGRRGFVLLTLHLTALLAIAHIPLLPDWVHRTVPLPDWDEWVRSSVTAMVLYVFIYAGFGAAVGRLGQAITPEFRPAHARVLTILVAALAMVAPYLPAMFEFTRPLSRDSIFLVTNPFSVLAVIERSGYPSSPLSLEQIFLFLSFLCIAAFIVLLINLKPMFNGMSELLYWGRTPTGSSTIQPEPAEPVAEWSDVACEDSSDTPSKAPGDSAAGQSPNDEEDSDSSA